MKLPFPKAVRAGDFVFVSGQMAIDAKGQLVEGSIEVQTRQVIDNIKAILAEAGCTMKDVVKCTCWLDDARDFGRFDAVYASYFEDDPPARSTVRAQPDAGRQARGRRRSPTSRSDGARDRHRMIGPACAGRSEKSLVHARDPSLAGEVGCSFRPRYQPPPWPPSVTFRAPPVTAPEWSRPRRP